MDKVDLENASNEVDTIIDLQRREQSSDRDPGPPSAAEYLLRLLSERYAAGWDDAMESVGSRFATPAPRPTKFREVRAR